ncbi:YbaB/EbfC family nucleoid-associated protein [Lentilactobacillus senioris]|nr:YbaB/EbfC family nucleoid-associated protein [Lentilactobacillus senioris]
MMNGMNMNKMMKQMQKMQKQLSAEQENLNQQSFVGKAPSDMVIATFSGDRKLTDLQIKPDAIDPEDPEMLSDLVLAAVNDGLQQVAAATEQTLGKYTKGIPGM